MIAKANMDLSKKKILFIDLDDTLIKTASGKTFAEDCTDFRIQKGVLDKIIETMPLDYINIVTNQGGMGTYFTEDDFYIKNATIIHFMQSYLHDRGIWLEITTSVCTTMDKNNPCRKPNCGFLEHFWKDHNDYTKDEMIMIGDASGKEGDFSDSDKKCAENFGIDYIDVRDFLNLE